MFNLFYILGLPDTVPLLILLINYRINDSSTTTSRLSAHKNNSNFKKLPASYGKNNNNKPIRYSSPPTRHNNAAKSSKYRHTPPKSH